VNSLIEIVLLLKVGKINAFVVYTRRVWYPGITSDVEGSKQLASILLAIPDPPQSFRVHLQWI